MAHFPDTASRPYPLARFRTGRLLLLTLLLTLATFLTGIETAQAQDGKAILLKAMKYYQSLTSYAGRANVDTMMLDANGKTVKHIGSSSVMKFQRPNRIYLDFQTPIGSRSVYSDGKNFSVYDASVNQYLTVPAPPDTEGLLTILLQRADVAAGLDPLFFLTKTNLPTALTDIKIKGNATYNGHAVYLITGTTNAKPVVIKNGSSTTTIPTSYWTWWIDRTTGLLYKVETRTPNIVKQVSFGSGTTRKVQLIKGTLFLRHTVTDLKPDTNVKQEEFVFTPPRGSIPKRTVQDVLPKKGK